MRGNRYFFTKNDGAKPERALLVDRPRRRAESVLDPNTFRRTARSALTDYEVSDDGKFARLRTRGRHRLAGVAGRGDETGKDLTTTYRVGEVVSGALWTPDNRGFYYSRYDEPKEA